ncbi:MAG TPA: PQQ-dependent sugar dehydrogenase [Bryobacteraceae bacterium]|nr:PQQ-dependent sugar dehydrogenase [Bryobacteraceae bacterium]
MNFSASRIRALAAIGMAAGLAAWVGAPEPQSSVHAQSGPSMVVPNLAVRTAVAGLAQPTSMAFLDASRFLVLEKASGQVKLVANGAVQKTVLDLGVNNASERGLLGIALHPQFPANSSVYLYWTCQAPPPTGDPFFPTLQECPDPPSLGADTNNILAVPLLGNRVDRFVWDSSAQTLAFDRNLIKLRAFQNDGAPTPPGQGDEGQPAQGNHNGGVIRFGPDGKLYIIIGDNGRRGQLQNLRFGPTPPTPDDQFGGPEPDNAHLTGVILRLNPDGSTPADNPFFAAGAAIGGQVGANIQKIFAYGVRNSFGMAFDPYSGNLWTQENGDDSFDEINRVEPGMNGGWVQIMGPVSRISEFKSIEVTMFGSSLQQRRWPPTRIADTPEEALSRLFLLPGAHYSDPEFSWKYAVAPAGIGFVVGRGLGPQYEGDLIIGAARTTLEGGYLFRSNLTGNRRKLGVDDPRLEDRVADNTEKFDLTESESLLFGRDFGVGTDIHTGPNGNLFVVSLSNGAVYEIYRTK